MNTSYTLTLPSHLPGLLMARRYLSLYALLMLAASVLLLSPCAPALAYGSPRYAYVAMNTDGVAMFDASTGALTPLQPPVIRRGFPVSIAVDPTGRFAYTAEYQPQCCSGNVGMYAIEATTGQLRLLGYVRAGDEPRSVAVDPSGRFVYAASAIPTSNSVSMYQITSTGELMPLGMVDAGDQPYSVAVDPTGRFAYVANYGGGVSMYQITSTGVLMPLGAVRAGSNPVSVAVDPSGRFVYAANEYDDTVSMYQIASTGVLTPRGNVATGRYPTSVAVDPSGRFVYAVNYGPSGTSTLSSVSVYEMDPTTGQLTALGSPMPLMGRGHAIAIVDFNSSGPGTPELTAPTPGATLADATVTFTWRSNGAAVSEWWLYLGSSQGAYDLLSHSLGTQLSVTVSNLPTDGRRLFVRLWYRIADQWQFGDFQYTTATAR